MKNDRLPDGLHEFVWRQKLTAAEREKLRAQPEILVELERESSLSEALARIPNVSVPSNFTARVLQAVELEDARHSRRLNFRWNWHALLPRIAVAAVAIIFAGFLFHRHEIYRSRAALAKNVAFVAAAQPLPNVEALKNFDAIQRMSQSAHADDELLALLQ